MGFLVVDDTEHSTAHGAVENAAGRKLRPLLRVGAVIVALSAALLAFAAHRARARLDETLLDLGSDMLRYPGALRQESPRRIYLNGMALAFSSGVTDQSVDAVLDHFSARCRAVSGMPPALEGDPPALDAMSALDGVLQVRRRDRGVVACLDTGVEQLALGELVDRLQTFLRTGDLRALGALRFVIAKRGVRRTLLLTLSTEGEAPILELFPQDRDAPGSDPRGLPRPSHSRRLLSARAEDGTAAIAVYAVKGAPLEAVSRRYRAALRRAGWKASAQPSASSPWRRDAFLAQRGDASASVILSTTHEGRALVTLMPMP